MKLVLVFPPFALPTYIPLGMAQLKSYLNSKNSSLNVKCLDLNLEFHKLHFSESKKKAKSNILPELEKNALLASILFKGLPKNLFNNKYDQLSRDFLYHLNVIHGQYDSETEALINHESHLKKYHKKLIDKVIKEAPDIVGFSTMISTQFSFACLIAKQIKKIRPEIKIVFGGSAFSDQANEKFNPEFMDFLIYGEAELGFSALLENLSSLEKVPNIIYVKDNNLVINKRTELKDLKDLPAPDFSDYKLKKYLNSFPVIPVSASRSCAWKKCTYCVHYNTFHDYKQKSVESFFNELIHYFMKGYNYFNFVDEMMLPDFLNKLCDKIITHNNGKMLNIFWHCTCKPSHDFNDELFSKMHKAGCSLIFWGIESGNQDILKKMNRGIDVSVMHDTLKSSTKFRIKNYALVIIGFPGESQKEFDDTKNFLDQNRKHIHSVIPNPFFLYKESEIFKNPADYGITKIYDKHKLKRNYIYDIDKGFNYDQIVLMYNVYQGFFDSFNTFSNSFNTLRDQALIYYSCIAFNENRKL